VNGYVTVRPPTSNRWAESISEALVESPEPEQDEKPVPDQRPLKKHPSFETWIKGSPHDSDEYDTDIDIEDYVKSKFPITIFYL